MARVRLKIDKDGNPTILDVCGGGTNCQENTANFEKLLGNADERTRAHTDSYTVDAAPELVNEASEG
jgi:hypothetical protein